MPDIPADYRLQSYVFDLPEELIAQQPAPERSASRLMALERGSGTCNGPRHAAFGELLDFLPEKALLVANNSRVVPARLTGARPGGGKAELLLLTPLPLLEATPAGAGQLPGGFAAEAEVLLKPAKKIRPGDIVRVGNDLAVELLERGDFGRCRVRLFWQGDLAGIVARQGAMPLPPYIKRPADGPKAEARRSEDLERYQTVYAKEEKAGSVAAPTAGLHFTPELLRALHDSGRQWAEISLYVGYGTFSPVRTEDIRAHAMHAEYVEVSAQTALAVNRAKAEGRPVIAVGTTAARSLEGAFAAQHEAGVWPGPGSAPAPCPGYGPAPRPHPEARVRRAAPPTAWPGLEAWSGWTDIFIYPGKPLRVVDGLITNFHLPGSSLLMLVCALAGRERVLAAYAEAVERRYRFFSYGDAMLII